MTTKENPRYPVIRLALNWIGSRLQHLHYKLAFLLNERTSGIKPRKWKAILFMFCTIAVCSLSYLAASSFNNDGHSSVVVGRPVIVSRHIMTDIKVQSIADEPPASVVLFRKYIDSLQTTSEGKKTLDSLQEFRPGLLDSVRQVEQLYSR